jgi:hypothetical protein
MYMFVCLFCMYVYVCMFVLYVCICLYVCMYVCIYTCMHVYCMHACTTYVRMHARMSVCVGITSQWQPVDHGRSHSFFEQFVQRLDSDELGYLYVSRPLGLFDWLCYEDYELG